LEYNCEAEWSAWGEPGKIWLTIRQSERYKTISLINLCGVQDDRWNAGKDRPDTQRDIAFAFLPEGGIEGIWYASPDINEGRPQAILYETVGSPQGPVIRFTIPELVNWGLVWIELA